jgi:uncharacterized protein (DUF58 family)
MMKAFLGKTLSEKKRSGKKQSGNDPIFFLPGTIKKKQICIRPTPYGILFIIILLGMLLGSVNYANNLGFLLTFLLGSMAFVSIVHTYKNLSGIRLISVGTGPVFANDKTVFQFVFRVPHKLHPSLACGFDTGNQVVQDLDCDIDNRMLLSFQVEKRGVFKADPIRISTVYPLGLFSASARLRVDVEYIVYPNPISGPINLSNGMDGSGQKGKKEQCDVDDFKGLRSYQEGDPVQRISWKTYSRGQGLFTKIFVSPTGNKTVLDWSRLKEPDVEKKLSVFCYGVLTAHRQNIVYGLNIPGATIAPGKGETHKHRCLKALAMFAHRPKTETRL